VIAQLIAAGRTVTSRVPWLAALSHHYGAPALGPIAKLIGRCRIRGCEFTTRAPFITLTAAGHMLRETYENCELRALDAVLDPALPIIECGASIGVLACIVNRRLHDPGAHVVVEANPELLPLLERHRRMNGSHFQIVHAAVSYGAVDVDFVISADSLASRLNGKGRRVVVPATTVAAVADRYHFARFGLLCDIEGAEMQLLDREESTLVTRARWVVVETHEAEDGRDQSPDVVRWFTSRGFRHAITQHTVHGFVNLNV
jgi:FkbM family methyltransferase